VSGCLTNHAGNMVQAGAYSVGSAHVVQKSTTCDRDFPFTIPAIVDESSQQHEAFASSQRSTAGTFQSSHPVFNRPTEQQVS